MIGGGGEKKTLRMVAQYADESNLICPLDEVPRKLDVLAAHCERARPRPPRDHGAASRSTCCIAPTHDAGLGRGQPLPRRIAASRPGRSRGPRRDPRPFVWGDPDEVAERLAAILDAGVDGFTFNLPGQRPRPRAGRAAGPDRRRSCSS